MTPTRSGPARCRPGRPCSSRSTTPSGAIGPASSSTLMGIAGPSISTSAMCRTTRSSAWRQPPSPRPPPSLSRRPDMQYRRFGSTGLRVSEMFLGAMTFGEQGGVGAPLDECRRIVDAYADAGGNVIDTAINYRGGASEEILGEVLAGRRDSFVLGTKYTVSRDRSDANGGGNHRKNLRLSLDTSLRRLRTDYLDIYWVHMWDERTPIEETMRALDDEVQAGEYA